MLKVEVHHDGHGKYYPIVTLNLWDCFRIWPIRHDIVTSAWASPFAIRFDLIRYKRVQLPEGWLEEYAESFFVLDTLALLGICPDPANSAERSMSNAA